MKVQVEFLLLHKHDVYEVGRIPCIGEHITVGFGDDDELHEVKEVFHVLNADPVTQVQAIIRVK